MDEFNGKIIYLDNASTTKMSSAVFGEMKPFLTSEYGNPGTLYPMGTRANEAVANARNNVAEFIGAVSQEQVIFTSGGTESNNMVFNHALQSGVKCIVTSKLEHSSVLRAAENCERHGCKVIFVKNDEDGIVDVADLRNILKNAEADLKPGLVSIMYVNNETGSINPVKQIANVCAEYGVPLHIDSVQAAGCINLNVQEIGCDFMSVSSHKIHGPKGVGALYVKNRALFTPLIFGGSSQEFGLRGGTENVAGIVGFGKACSMLIEYEKSQNLDIGIFPTILKRAFWKSIKESANRLGIGDKLHDNASSAESYGRILNIRFDGVDAESLVVLLGTRGICVSAGSACTSHEQKPSHVLTNVGLTEHNARESVRISFSRMNRLSEVVYAADAMAKAVLFLIEMS